MIHWSFFIILERGAAALPGRQPKETETQFRVTGPWKFSVMVMVIRSTEGDPIIKARCSLYSVSTWQWGKKDPNVDMYYSDKLIVILPANMFAYDTTRL